MSIPSFIRYVRSHWKYFVRRMQRPFVVSNGTKVREDETEVLAACGNLQSRTFVRALIFGLPSKGVEQYASHIHRGRRTEI
jgi:ABC-type antimicrobial peptide transport system permease subunit